MAPQNQRKSSVVRSQAPAQPEPARRLPIAEEHVRSGAYGLFQARLRAGRRGDSVSDWLQAERQLRARQTTAQLKELLKVRRGLRS
jgi:hypothetical protein